VTAIQVRRDWSVQPASVLSPAAMRAVDHALDDALCLH
jgi:hypothetical protein